MVTWTLGVDGVPRRVAAELNAIHADDFGDFFSENSATHGFFLAGSATLFFIPSNLL